MLLKCRIRNNKVNFIQIFVLFIQLVCWQKYCFVLILQGRGNIKNYCFHQWPITIKRDISETKRLFFIWSNKCSCNTKHLMIEQGSVKIYVCLFNFYANKNTVLFWFPEKIFRSSRPEMFLRRGCCKATLLKSHVGMGVLL